MAKNLIRKDPIRINCNRERVRQFLHSRQWLWLPGVMIVTFVAFFLLNRFVAELSQQDAVTKSCIYALVLAFCWALGVWAATDQRPNPYEERTREKTERGETVAEPSWTGRIVIGSLLVVCFAGFCWTQLEGWYTGEIPAVRALVGILLKAAAVAAILLPGWLEKRRG